MALPKPTSVDLGEGGDEICFEDDDGLNAAIDDLEEATSAAARASDGDVRRIPSCRCISSQWNCWKGQAGRGGGYRCHSTSRTCLVVVGLVSGQTKLARLVTVISEENSPTLGSSM